MIATGDPPDRTPAAVAFDARPPAAGDPQPAALRYLPSTEKA